MDISSLYKKGSGNVGGSLKRTIVVLKVSKFRKQIFLFSFEPKNERNNFLIPAQASKNGSNQTMKALYYINYGIFNVIDTFIF